MNPILRTFYNNDKEREAVKDFLIEVLKELAVEKAFAGEPVLGIKEANELITKAFDKLAELYGIIEKPVITNSK